MKDQETKDPETEDQEVVNPRRVSTVIRTRMVLQEVHPMGPTQRMARTARTVNPRTQTPEAAKDLTMVQALEITKDRTTTQALATALASQALTNPTQAEAELLA
jgi:alpha-ketoglutarate-dependent taurine dioxygenase